MDLLQPASLVAERILVVAPHPDDESLGCGGLMAAMADLRRRVHTVFVTDGGASHRNSPTWPRRRLAARREEEAAEALARLGLKDHPRTFLRLPDANMPNPASPEGGTALAAMRAVVADFLPDLALLPWRRDPHCDHRDAWRLATQALDREGLRPQRLEYAIWLDELGAEEDRPRPGEAERIVFDISAVLPRKRSAVAAHASQTTDLIPDDPEAFRLTEATIRRLAQREEAYWKPAA